jgi:hypothetical protein
MNKKRYLTPDIKVISAETTQMIAYSGGGQGTGITISDDVDNGPDINLSRDGFGFDNDEGIITPGASLYFPF